MHLPLTKEMCSFGLWVQKLKVSGTDQGMSISSGFAMDNTELKLLLCVYHLEKSDRHKLSKLNPKNGAINKILADIYQCRYGSVKEFGLADSATADDFKSCLVSLKKRWDSLCQ